MTTDRQPSDPSPATEKDVQSAEASSPDSGAEGTRRDKSRKRRKASHSAAPQADKREMQQKFADLETELQEKEQLVTALTERLEQAAEQLDRVRRTGADRGVRMGGGIPPELIENQKTLLEELQHAVQQWEDMQAAAALGRLEVQVSELRDLVAGQLVSGGLAPGSTRHLAATDETARPADSQTQASSAGDPAGGWEALKANLLGADGDAASEPVAHDPQPIEPVRPEEIEPADAPAPLDLAEAGPEELRDAVESRDAYIAYLIRKLRLAEAHHRTPPDWTELDNAPAELRNRLETLERQYEEKLRLAEVEHSLERARLGREESRLRQLEEQIQKEVKRLAMHQKAEGSAEHRGDAADSGDHSKGSRWRRVLGMGNDDM